MASEQLFGDAHRVGPAADIYGLGAVLYTLLIGRPLHNGRSPEKIIEQRLKGSPPTPLRAVRSDLPQSLEVIVKPCLAADPNERVGSMTDLAAALRDVG